MIDPATLAGMKIGGEAIGGVTSYFGNKAKLDAERRALNKQIEGENAAYGVGKDYYDYLQGQYGPEASSYLSDLALLRGAQSKAPVELGTFDDSGYTINKYLDPYANISTN